MMTATEEYNRYWRGLAGEPGNAQAESLDGHTSCIFARIEGGDIYKNDRRPRCKEHGVDDKY
jgi:hypothetical protein